MYHSDSSLASVAQTLFEAFEGHYTLLAIPFFILASSYMSTGGVAKRIIRFAIATVGHVRGGESDSFGERSSQPLQKLHREPKLQSSYPEYNRAPH